MRLGVVGLAGPGAVYGDFRLQCLENSRMLRDRSGGGVRVDHAASDPGADVRLLALVLSRITSGQAQD